MKLATFLTAFFGWPHAENETNRPGGNPGPVPGAAAGRMEGTRAVLRSGRSERAAAVRRWPLASYFTKPQLPEQLAGAARYFPGLHHLLSATKGLNGKALDATPQQLATYFGLIASGPGTDGPYSWKSFLNDCWVWGIDSIQKKVQKQAGYDSPNVRRFMHWVDHVEPCIDAIINGVQLPPELADGFSEAAEYFPGLLSLADAIDRFDWTGSGATPEYLAAYFGLIASTSGTGGSHTWESFLRDCTIYGFEDVQKKVRQQAGYDSPEVLRLMHWENDVLPYIGEAIQQWSARVSQHSRSSAQPVQVFPQLRTRQNSNRDDGISSQGSGVASAGKTKRGSWGWGETSRPNGSSVRGEGRRLKKRPGARMDEQGGLVTSAGKTKRGPWGWGDTDSMSDSSVSGESRSLDEASPRVERPGSSAQPAPGSYPPRSRRNASQDRRVSPPAARVDYPRKAEGNPWGWDATSSSSASSVSGESQRVGEEIDAPMDEQERSGGTEADADNERWRASANRVMRRWSDRSRSAAAVATSGPTAKGRGPRVAAPGRSSHRTAPPGNEIGSRTIPYSELNSRENQQDIAALGREGEQSGSPIMVNKAKTLAWSSGLFNTSMQDPEFANRELVLTQKSGAGILGKRLNPNTPRIVVERTADFIDCAALENGAQVVDAANEYLGGGLLLRDPGDPRNLPGRRGGRGWVWEEQMFATLGLDKVIPTLRHTPMGKTRRTQYTSTNDADFTPVLIKNASPLFSIDKETALLTARDQGRRDDDNMYTNQEFDPAATFEVAGDRKKTVDVACIAAPELRQHERGQLYARSTVRDMVGNCAITGEMVRTSETLHSGPWGTGAFKHSFEMSFASQMLGFGFNGLPVKFWGVGERHLQAYNDALAVVQGILRKVEGQPVTLEYLADQLWRESQRLGWTTQP
jgi:hypothetical protein